MGLLAQGQSPSAGRGPLARVLQPCRRPPPRSAHLGPIARTGRRCHALLTTLAHFPSLQQGWGWGGNHVAREQHLGQGHSDADHPEPPLTLRALGPPQPLLFRIRKMGMAQGPGAAAAERQTQAVPRPGWTPVGRHVWPWQGGWGGGSSQLGSLPPPLLRARARGWRHLGPPQPWTCMEFWAPGSRLAWAWLLRPYAE